MMILFVRSLYHSTLYLLIILSLSRHVYHARFSQSRLKNIDQNSEQQMEVTVGNVTVVITDYKLLPVKDEKSPPPSPQQQEQVVPVDKEQSDKTSDSGKNENKEHADAQELINS